MAIVKLWSNITKLLDLQCQYQKQDTNYMYRIVLFVR